MQDAFFGVRAQCLASLAIHTDKVLMPGNNPGLDGGDSTRIGDDPFIDDSRCSQAFSQRPSGLVSDALTAANDAEDLHMRAKRRKIRGDVPRSAQTLALFHDIHHRDGGHR
jgi:hypothetical protein